MSVTLTHWHKGLPSSTQHHSENSNWCSCSPVHGPHMKPMLQPHTSTHTHTQAYIKAPLSTPPSLPAAAPPRKEGRNIWWLWRCRPFTDVLYTAEKHLSSQLADTHSTQCETASEQEPSRVLNSHAFAKFAVRDAGLRAWHVGRVPRLRGLITLPARPPAWTPRNESFPQEEPRLYEHSNLPIRPEPFPKSPRGIAGVITPLRHPQRAFCKFTDGSLSVSGSAASAAAARP